MHFIPTTLMLHSVLILWSSATLADESHPREFLPGGKAAMLGGAYTALANDPTGLFYNPAGLGFVERNELSANATGFYEKATIYEKAINSNNFVRYANSNFPSFVGNTYKRSAFTLGFAILTLDNRNTKQTDYFTNISSVENAANTYSRFQHENNQLHNYGVGWSIRLGPLSLGSSHFYYEYSKEATIHQTVLFNGGLIRSIDQSLSSQANGLIHHIGAQLRVEKISIGVMVRSAKEIHEESSIKQDSILHQPNAEPMYQHDELEVEGLDHRIPDSQSLGVAWIDKSLMLSADITHYSSLPHRSLPVFDYQPMTNYSLGAETYLGKSYFLRFGLFTNNDLSQEMAAGTYNINQLDHIDFIGSSIGAGFRSKDFESSLGYVIQSGSGEAQIVAGNNAVQKMQASSQLILLSLRYLTN